MATISRQLVFFRLVAAECRIGGTPSRWHPDYLGEISVTEAAARLGVTRTALSRILNGSAGISADMALRLRDALGTSAEMWVNMQAQYDLWQAEKKTRPQVVPFREPVAA